jgi:hypothetical protein
MIPRTTEGRGQSHRGIVTSSSNKITDFIFGTFNGFSVRTSLIKFKKDESIILEYYNKNGSTSTMNGHVEQNGIETGDHNPEQGCIWMEDSPIITKQLVSQKYYAPNETSSITCIDINPSLNLCLVKTFAQKYNATQ